MSRSLLATAKVAALLVLVVAGALLIGPAEAAGGNTITAPDTGGNVGNFSSLVLDSGGNPVVSYYDGTNEYLKIVACGDPSCSSGNTFAFPDTVGQTGFSTSLKIDSSGRPVASYVGNSTLKVLRCGNAGCTAGNIIVTVDTASQTFRTAIALDDSEHPVVAYYSANEVKVVHCGNPTCSGGNIITTLASDISGSPDLSLELDASGSPLVVFSDFSSGSIGVVRCGNPNCTTGNVSTILSVPLLGDNGGEYLSAKLDSSDNPVVVYIDGGVKGDLLLLRCGDSDCTTGNSISTLDGSGISRFMSLVLDDADRPVVAYWRGAQIVVRRCSDLSCSTSTTASFDSAVTGFSMSLALDSQDRPVVSYLANDSDLKVLHCGDPACTGAKPVGGISLDSDLRPLPLETSQSSSPPWAVVVGIAGVACLLGLGGGAWYARRRLVS